MPEPHRPTADEAPENFKEVFEAAKPKLIEPAITGSAGQKMAAQAAADVIRDTITQLMEQVRIVESMGIRVYLCIDSDEKNPQIKHFCNQRISQDI